MFNLLRDTCELADGDCEIPPGMYHIRGKPTW